MAHAGAKKRLLDIVSFHCRVGSGYRLSQKNDPMFFFADFWTSIRDQVCSYLIFVIRLKLGDGGHNLGQTWL